MLVPLEEPRKASRAPAPAEVLDAEATPHPPVVRARTSLASRLVLALALVGAFLLGAFFPRTEPETAPTATPAAPVTRAPTHPIAGADNGEIELMELRQTGEQIMASFRTVVGFENPRRIEGAAVEVTVRHGAQESSFGLSEVRLVADGTGFSIGGRLDAPGTVVELRITTIQVRAENVPSWDVDISPIWPVGAAEPKVMRVPQPARPVAEGSVRLIAILGWSDRMEAVFELRGLGGVAGNRSEITGLELLLGAPSASDGRAVAASSTEQVSAGQLIARFEAVPGDAGPVVIRATQLLDFVAGPWTWRLA